MSFTIHNTLIFKKKGHMKVYSMIALSAITACSASDPLVTPIKSNEQYSTKKSENNTQEKNTLSYDSDEDHKKQGALALMIIRQAFAYNIKTSSGKIEKSKKS
jgi:major membrane immunogen (membrane-anchored lipoprotein)